jgi:pSer/pThr/pTyr-binding forkhead associated (FHA) protein
VRKDPGAQRGANITLGQSADNDIVIPEYSISTQHCAFAFDAAGMSILDLGSLNGIKINDALIEPQVNFRLKNGLAITVGRVKLKFLQAESFVDLVASVSRGL